MQSTSSKINQIQPDSEDSSNYTSFLQVGELVSQGDIQQLKACVESGIQFIQGKLNEENDRPSDDYGQYTGQIAEKEAQLDRAIDELCVVNDNLAAAQSAEKAASSAAQ